MSKPTAERVRELLNYDPLSGLFTWRVDRKNGAINAGSIAGWVDSSSGYVRLRVDGKFYQAHRLAWLVTTGTWPADQIDHANGIKTDNRWVNMRPATHSQNCANVRRRADNTSGKKGVRWHKGAGKWQARISFNGRSYHIKLTADFAEAEAAYAFASRLCFGEFHNTREQQ